MRYTEAPVANVTRIRPPVNRWKSRLFLLTTGFLSSILGLLPAVGSASIDEWYPAGPPGGDVKQVVVDPVDPTRVYAVVGNAGLYRSSDAGNSWTLASSEVTTPYTSQGLAIAPSETSVLYAVQVERVLGSRDSGVSWLDLNAPRRATSGGEIAVHPANSNIVIVTDPSGSALVASVDGGATWEFRGDRENLRNIVFNSSEPFELYGFSPRTSGGTHCLYRSTDSGFTWEDLGLCDVWTMAVDPSDPLHLLIGGYSIWRSTDGGSSLNEVYSGGYSGTIRCLAFDPLESDLVWAGTANGVVRSTDGGALWIPASEGLDSLDVRTIAVTAGEPSHVLVGTAMGITARDPEDMAWKPANRGLPGVPVKKAVIVAGAPPVWLATTEDNLLRSEDEGLSWSPSNAGLPPGRAWATPHPSLPGIVFARSSAQRDKIYRSADGGRTWEEYAIAPGRITSLHPDPIDPDIMYALIYHGGYWNKLIKTTDGGTEWSQIHNKQDLTLAIDPTDPNVLLAGGVGAIYRSANGGQTWRKTLDGGGNAVEIGAIEFDPIVFGRVFASGAGFKISDDGGMTWPTGSHSAWYSRDLQSDSAVADTLYAGGSGFGVWFERSQDGGRTFSPWSDGLHGGVSNLAITPGGDGLLAATDAGLFHLRLAEIAAVSPDRGPTAGGTLVEIVGGRFGSGTTVNFGGLDSETVTVVSESRLMAVTPPHAEGSVDVTVVTPEGRLVVTGGAYQYTDTQALGVSLTPDVQTVSIGETATLKIEIDEVQSGDLVVTLAASDQSALDLPDEVIVAAGETETNVQAAALEEGLAVRVTATLPVVHGGASTMALVKVVVDEQDFKPAMMVPGVARVSGAQGSTFRTSLWVTNPHENDNTVRVRFVPALGQSPGGGAETVEIAVFSGQSRVFEDVLLQVFGTTGETFGSIVVETVDGTPMPVVSARTFNHSVQGTFGQYIEAIDIPDGSDPFAGEQLVVGLGGNADFRSNLGVVNLGDSNLQAEISVVGPDGIELGEAITVDLPPYSMHQINKVNRQAGAGARRLFNVRVGGGGPFFSYGSMLDNKTSDPVFVPAAYVDEYQRGLLQGGPSADLDGVAASPGANQTFFRSSLVVTNVSGGSAGVDAHFCEWGESAAYDNPVSLELAAGETRRYDDVVQDLFDRTGVAGTVHLDSGPQEIVAWARTYNDGGAAGTFGQFVAPILGAGGYLNGPAILHGLSEDAAFRTNMGVWPRSDTTLGVSLYTADGNLVGHKVYQLSAQTQLFVPRVARDLGVSSVSGGFLRLEPGTQGAVAVWTSSVDNRSSDQTFMRPMAVP